MSQHGTTAPLTSPGAVALQLPPESAGRPALLLATLLLVGALMGAGLLVAGLAWRGDLVTLTHDMPAAIPAAYAMPPDDELRAIRQLLVRGDPASEAAARLRLSALIEQQDRRGLDAPPALMQTMARIDRATAAMEQAGRHFWNSPAALLAAVLLLAVGAVSIWIRALSRRPTTADPAMSADPPNGSIEDAMERDMAPLRELAASLAQIVRAGARLASGAVDAEERLRATVLRAEATHASPVQTPPTDPGIIRLMQTVEATLRANQHAEKLERAIPELLLAVAQLSQSGAVNTARRIEAALTGLDQSAGAVAEQSWALSQTSQTLHRAALACEAALAAVPDAAARMTLSADRLAQGGQEVVAALDRSAGNLELYGDAIAATAEHAAMVIASLPEAASLVNAAASRLTQDSLGIGAALDRSGTTIDLLQRGAADFAAQAQSLSATHDQTAMMLGALPEATLLVHAAADRLERLSLATSARLGTNGEIARLLIDADALARSATENAAAQEPDADMPDRAAVLESLRNTIAQLQWVATELAEATQNQRVAA